MKVGDIVSWASSSNGTRLRKEGQIVEAIPPGKDPLDTLSVQCGHFSLARLGGGRPRNHESYLVVFRGALYWPRVSQLVLEKAA